MFCQFAQTRYSKMNNRNAAIRNLAEFRNFLCDKDYPEMHNFAKKRKFCLDILWDVCYNSARRAIQK